MKKKIYYLFGGCPSQKRAKRLVERWEKDGKKGYFIVTGYPNEDKGEVETMIQFLISKGVPKENIFIDASYETFSNVESLEKFLTKEGMELDQCEIYASTGPLHWFRFKLIFLWEFLYGEHFNFFGITFLPSGEKEVWYAVIVIMPYIVFTPKGWQIITRFIRRKQYKLCKEHKAIKEIAEKYGVNLID